MLQQKKTQGRKKIEIKKIDSMSSRQVTFSKRRTGLFNKASELCVLTGAEAAIITQSPGGRVFAFGHPSVDSVVDKYVSGSSNVLQENMAVNEFNSNEFNSIPASMHESFNQKYKEISKEIEDEKKNNVVEDKVLEDGPNFWWQESFEHLGIEELEKYIVSMEQMKDNITMRVDEMVLLRNSSKFDIFKSSKNEGSDVFDQLNDQKTEGGGIVGGSDHMLLNYPPGFNFGSGA